MGVLLVVLGYSFAFGLKFYYDNKPLFFIIVFLAIIATIVCSIFFVAIGKKQKKMLDSILALENETFSKELNTISDESLLKKLKSRCHSDLRLSQINARITCLLKEKNDSQFTQNSDNLISLLSSPSKRFTETYQSYFRMLDALFSTSEREHPLFEARVMYLKPFELEVLSARCDDIFLLEYEEYLSDMLQFEAYSMLFFAKQHNIVVIENLDSEFQYGFSDEEVKPGTYDTYDRFNTYLNGLFQFVSNNLSKATWHQDARKCVALLASSEIPTFNYVYRTASINTMVH